jgi:hypothetical protein
MTRKPHDSGSRSESLTLKSRSRACLHVTDVPETGQVNGDPIARLPIRVHNPTCNSWAVVAHDTALLAGYGEPV